MLIAEKEHQYDLHRVSLRLRFEDETLGQTAAGLLRNFTAEQAADDDSHAWQASVLSVAKPSRIPRARSPAAQLAFAQPRIGFDGSAWDYTVWRDGGRTVIEVSDRGLVTVEPTLRRAEAWAVRPGTWTEEEREGLVFLLASEILRASGLYPLHAAAGELDGRAVLILGSSGAGKSTCLLSLMRAGWRCLSDDHPLVCETDDGPRVLPWPARLEITAETPPRFSGLSGLVTRVGERKLWLYPEEVGAGAAREPVRPALLLFPKVVDCPQSNAEPVSARFALGELLRLGMAVVHRNAAARQFALLARLARETPRARLFFGSDVEHLPALVDGLLEATTG